MGAIFFKQMLMNIKPYLLIFFAGSFLLNACQKNVDIFIPDPGQINGPDTTWHATVTASMPVSALKNNLLEEPYQDSILVNTNTVSVLSPSGLLVTFPPNSCATAAGQPVTGKVQVALHVVKKKGDMIRLNKPSTYNDSMLVTAFQIFIQLKKDGQPVQLAPNVKINIRYVDQPSNQQMKFFAGDETNALRFNWLPNTDTISRLYIGSQAYEIVTNRLRWISAAYVYNLNNTAGVSVRTELASYFTNANTIAFTVFNDIRSVVAMHADINTRKFISGKLPLGKRITVVVISKQGNDYYLGYEATTTVAVTTGSLNQAVPVTPIKRSLPEILSYLSTL